MRKHLAILTSLMAACGCGRSQFETSALAAATSGAASNDIIRIHSSDRMAGAIDSLTFGGTEFINAFDHGRELQTAYTLDNAGECYNPTEAGSEPDGTGPASSSRLLTYAAAGSLLTSSVHPAFWMRPGTPHASGLCSAVNTTVTSPDLIEKRVDVGFGGIRHILKYHVRVTLAQAHQAFQIEGATGYQMAAFNRLFAWNQDSATLSPVPDTAYGEQSQPAIAATADGQRAIGAWAPQLAGYSLSYGRGYFPGDAASGTSKWTVVYRRGATPAGSYEFDVYIAVGSLENVRVALAQVKQIVGGATPGPATLPIARGFNGFDHLFTADAAELARAGYRPEGAPFAVWPAPPAGVAVRAVYRCLAGPMHFLSSEPGCEGQRTEGLLGYLRAQGGTELVRCFGGSDHLLSSRAECAAARYPVEGVLGYAL
jgi:hypothetical protein